MGRGPLGVLNSQTPRCTPLLMLVTDSPYRGPILTLAVQAQLLAARAAAAPSCKVSLDLGISVTSIETTAEHWAWQGNNYSYPNTLKERTAYRWVGDGDGDGYAAIARFDGGLYKLVPTDWGAPTFEIDGIKMLPTAQVSPLADAARKVGLVAVAGKRVLDTCGGLGYFARSALVAGAVEIRSFEKSASVLWLRQHNPYSPDTSQPSALKLEHADVTAAITKLPDAYFDALLHDPPRFGIAGELYSQSFYNELARVLKAGGKMFHYTGAPNSKSRGRDLPAEVAKRLQKAGFSTQAEGDGVLATRQSRINKT